MLHISITFRRIRTFLTPLRGYTSSEPPYGGPPFPQGEGFGAVLIYTAKQQFILSILGHTIQTSSLEFMQTILNAY